MSDESYRRLAAHMDRLPPDLDTAWREIVAEQAQRGRR